MMKTESEDAAGDENETVSGDTEEYGSEEVLVLSGASEDSSGSSWWVSSLIVVNAAMGAGMLNLPAAFDAAGGVWAGTGVHVGVLLLAGASLLLLGWAADGASLSRDGPPPRSHSYQATVARVAGRPAGVACSLVVALYMYLASITYLVVVGDQTDRIFLDKFGERFCAHWYLDRRFVIAAGTAVLVWPLCYARRIDFLKYASVAATFGIFYVLGIVVYVFATTDRSRVELKSGPSHWSDVFLVLPAICFSYQCHVSSVPVYSCVRPRRLSYFARTLAAALALCFVSYSAIGVLGYVTFGRGVRADLLSSYDTTRWPIALGFVLFGVKNLLTFPIILFCGRLALEDVWAELFGADASSPDSSEGGQEPESRGAWWRRVSVVTVWVGTAVGFAVEVPSMTLVVEYLGCLAALFIFVVPGLCGWRAALSDVCVLPRRRKLAVAAGSALLLVFGAFLFGLILTQAARAPKEAKGRLCVLGNDTRVTLSLWH